MHQTLINLLEAMFLLYQPLPDVWSEDGPVREDGVLPALRVQSKVSFLACTKPHAELSKLQLNARKVTCWLEY